jgi:hypothetical protein
MLLEHTPQDMQATQQAQSAVLLFEKLIYETNLSAKGENEGSHFFLKFTLQRGDLNKSAHYG